MAAEIPDGAVVVARAILNSSLWTMRPEDCKVAMTCIALCNFRPGTWRVEGETITIKRGQFIRSREKLAKACNLPLQVVRTSIKRLEKDRDAGGTPFLTRKVTRRYTLYTLPKYDFYQDLSHYSDSVNPTSNPKSKNPNLTRTIAKTNPKSSKNQPEVEKPTQSSKSASKPKSRSRKTSTQPKKSKKLTRESRISNHKQEQQQQECNKQEPTPPSPPMTTKSRKSIDHGANGTADHLLNQISYKRGVLLLLSIGVKEKTAQKLAEMRSIGEIVDVVQVAHRKNSPSGFAIKAIQDRYGVPVDQAARAEIMADLKADRKRAQTIVRSKQHKNPKYARLPNESSDAWLERVTDIQRAEKAKRKRKVST